MLWLRRSDTETDRTKLRQTCITSGVNEPESSPELQKLQKNNFAIFRQIYAAESIRTNRATETAGVENVTPHSRRDNRCPPANDFSVYLGPRE